MNKAASQNVSAQPTIVCPSILARRAMKPSTIRYCGLSKKKRQSHEQEKYLWWGVEKTPHLLYNMGTASEPFA